MKTAMKDNVLDPVCGMAVPEDGEYTLELNGVLYSFCSAGCQTKFEVNHAKYVSAANTPPKTALTYGYTCPMHPEVQQEAPGSCIKCGMALVPFATHNGGRVAWPQHCVLRKQAILWGFISGVALVVVYLAVLALANSTEHALTEFGRLWYWTMPLILGFAVQLGLFAYARRAMRDSGAPTRGVIASGGVSTLSMIACCAHHLTDVLPLIGLAGAALFLADYQMLFLLLGLLSNVVGIVYMLGTLRRHGLFPETRGLLAFCMRLPMERAFIPAALMSALIFAVAVITATT